MCSFDCDIICVCETHLSAVEDIFVPGYSWFGYHRTEIHNRTPKPSGGVGILIKKWILDDYNVSIIDKSFNGILGLKFLNRKTDSDFIIFVCYLPPEISARGRDAQTFFSHLLTQIYIYDESDAILLAGDFNSRIGSLPDSVSDIDCVPKRKPLDKSINQHGHEFIDFLNESKFCVLNGRLIDCDNFTSISTKGKAVVDYICVPHDMLSRCKYFSVLTAESIVHNNDLI